MLILISGAPLSGKSTICRKLRKYFGDSSRLLSTDEFRKNMTGSYSDYSKEYDIWAEIVKVATKNLEKQKIVILDATLRQKDLRLKHIEYYKKYPICLISFEKLPIDVLLERNRQRTWKQLDEATLMKFWDSYEVPDEAELQLYDYSIVVNNGNSDGKLAELITYIEEGRK